MRSSPLPPCACAQMSVRTVSSALRLVAGEGLDGNRHSCFRSSELSAPRNHPMHEQQTPASYSEPAREVPVVADVDVLVAGGGPAGVGAAIGAARTGASVFLVEEMGALGGMWTQGLVITLAGYNSWLQPDRVRVVDGVGGEWLRRAAAIGGAVDHDGWVLSTDPEKMKLVADELLEEAGVDFLLHVLATYPIVEDGAVTGCLIETREGRQAIRAKVTVDATGNGDVIARSGDDW